MGPADGNAGGKVRFPNACTVTARGAAVLRALLLLYAARACAQIAYIYCRPNESIAALAVDALRHVSPRDEGA